MKRFMMFLTTFLQVSLTTQAQDSLNVARVGQLELWSMSWAVVVQDTLVYVAADGAGLRIVNVANPATPREIGFYDTPGQAVDLAVAHGYAYVADLTGDLRVVNIANPAAPTEVSAYIGSGLATVVAVAGSYAYVFFEPDASGGNALHILDITNPGTPEWRGTYNTGGVEDIVVVAGFAYIASFGSTLEIVNVWNPASPFEESDEQFWQVNSGCGIAVRGDYAFLSHCVLGEGARHHMSVIDISDREDPELAGFCQIGGQGLKISLSGNCAFVAANLAGLCVADVSSLTNPIRVACGNWCSHSKDVAVSDHYAYVADGGNGLVILNVASCSAPVREGYYSAEGQAVAVAVQGSYAYVAREESGLRVLNVSSQALPIEVGFFDSPGIASDVVVLGDYAYVADGSRGGLRIINIANPAAPTEEGYWDSTGAVGVDVSGNYAYVVSGSVLTAINISSHSEPVEADHYSASSSLRRVAVSGNYAYAVGATGMRVIDISDPTDLHVVGSYNALGGARDVVVSGGYAYLTMAQDPGFRVIRIVDPENPVEVGGCDIPWTSPDGVDVQGNYAFVADLDSGLRVIDVTNPEAPTEVGFYDTPGDAYDVAVSGIYAYVADGDYFGIYDCSALGTTPHPSMTVSFRLVLHPAFPNPFNATATISYDLPHAGHISLRVFDLLGREVSVLKDGFSEAGTHRVTFDGSGMASGIYFARLDAGTVSQTRKLMLLE